MGRLSPATFEEGGFSARQLQRSVSPETSVGGARAWLVVAVAFLTNVVAFGITYSFGVMFESLSTEFGAGRGATASVFSLAMALHFLLGVLTGPVADRRGPRTLLLVGAFVMSAGLLFTSAAPFGAANLGWMLVLGILMAVEKNVPWGRRLGRPLGVALLLLGLVVAMRLDARIW
jgi:MFS family permease